MTIDKLRENIVNCANEMYFEYNGEQCGIDQEVQDGVVIYYLWYGTQLKEHSDFNAMINDPLFNGKAIADLLDEVEFRFY